MTADLQTEMPVLNSLVRIGPAEFIAGEVVHQAKHQGTGRYFRMGKREVFLLSRLDGRHTPEALAYEYKAEFGRNIQVESIEKALELFASRGLIDASEPVPQSAPEAEEDNPMGTFAGKVFHCNPDRLAASLAPWFRWFINGPSFIIWAALLVAVEVLVFSKRNQLWAACVHSGGTPLWERFLLLSFISLAVTVVHECGHAIACKRFGGQVEEMGLLFRYFCLFAYTRIDDVVLLPKRLERVYVVMIGPLINASVIPLALLGWMHSAPGTTVHTVATDLLIWYNLSVLIQLLPFLQFDGYFVLTHLLRMPDLRKDSTRFMVNLLMRRLNPKVKPLAVSSACPGYVTSVYLGYALTSSVVTAVALAAVFFEYVQHMVQFVGIIPTVVLGSVLAAVILKQFYSKTLPWIMRNAAGAQI